MLPPIPIPDWTRLRPQKIPPSGGSGGSNKGEFSGCLLELGSIPVAAAGAIAGFVGARAVLPWLAIPGGVIGLIAAAAILRRTILGGVAQATFYAFVTFIFTGGRDRADPTPSLVMASVAAALFLSATYSRWKNR
jgi:hypothetical protein